MSKGLTFEELVQMGGQAGAPGEPQAQPVTYDQLVKAGAVVPPEVGPKETYVNDTVNTLPLGRLITDSVGTAVMQGAKLLGTGTPSAKLTPQAQADLQKMGEHYDPNANGIPGVMDTYRSIRDTRALRTEAGEDQNPVAAAFGKGTGIALSVMAPLPKVAVGANATTKAGMIAGRVMSAGLNGAGYGALSGLTDGKADLTRDQYADAVTDTLLGGGVGGTTGVVLGGATELARPLAGALAKWGIRMGRRVLTNGADSLSTRKPVSDEAVRTAIEDGGIRPFSTTEKTLDRLDALTERQGQLYGHLVNELEKRGVQGPEAAKVADELVRKGAGLERNTMNDALSQEYLDRALQLVGKAKPNPNLNLSQAEEMKRSLQELARYGRVEETPMNEVRRDIASVVRQANEDAISDAAQRAGPQSEVSELGEYFVPVKQHLGALIEARDAAQRGAARAAQRSAIGLPEKIAIAGGVATGNPAVLMGGPAVAAGGAFLKNRLPSAVASYSLGLSNALRDGVAHSQMGRYGGELSPVVVDAASDKLARIAQDPNQDPRMRALAEALRDWRKK
jgi:hypothetical protein